MTSNETKSLLRIYLSSCDMETDQPLYEKIVAMANEFGIAGATVLKGVLGYKAKNVGSSLKMTEIKEKYPIVIEIVDNNDKVLSFFDKIKAKFDNMPKGCLITIENLDILLYR